MQYRVNHIEDLRGKPNPMDLCKEMWNKEEQKERDRYEKEYRDAAEKHK